MKLALVVGGAGCMRDDLASAFALFTPDLIYAVNDVGAQLSELDVWCTLHPEYLGEWEDRRLHNGLDRMYETVAPPDLELDPELLPTTAITRRVSYMWPGMGPSGSSGLYGAKVALGDGADRVVLAGVPMTRTSGHYLRPGPWGGITSFVNAWHISKQHLVGRVRSLSGWTKEFLGGAPTRAWLGIDGG